MRRAVDAAGADHGRYLLTGSAAPKDDANRHSGAGRFGVLRMRTMSLFESGHSTGDVSLAALMQDRAQKGAGSGMTLPQLMERIIIGGWPGLRGSSEAEARIWLRGYLEQIIQVDIPALVSRRDPLMLSRVLLSLARLVAHSPQIRALAADVGGERGPISPTTIYRYLDALERLQLVDNSAAWQPHMRSRSRLRKAATRYFVDPAIGAAALHLKSEDLLNDLKTAGYHFEALVIRDLRIYAQPLGGRVESWRDENGNEVDAVIALPGGHWAAAEIKLNPSDIDRAAAILPKLKKRVDIEKQGQPSALIVVTSAGAAGRRADGVHVAPSPPWHPRASTLPGPLPG